MKKNLPVHPLPDMKNSFKNWVEQFQTIRQPVKTSATPVIKSVYIRKSGKNLNKTLQDWDRIQNESKKQYQDKIMDSIIKEFVQTDLQVHNLKQLVKAGVVRLARDEQEHELIV